MFDELKTYLQQKALLTDAELETVRASCSFKQLRRKQYLLQAGDTWKYHVFVAKGLLKLYYLDAKGQESIMQFTPENHWTGDRESMMTDQPSKYYIDAIENSALVLIAKDDFEMLRQQIPAFNDFVNETLKKNIVAHQERIHVSIAYTAEEKYQAFIRQFPDVANRIPLHMIASYLGISPETLSRIRSNLAKNNTS